MASESRLGYTGLAVIMVIAIIGMIAVTAIMGLSVQQEDQRKVSHAYAFDGTYDSAAVEGTGSSKFFEEGAEAYIYRFSFSAGDAGFHFDLFLDSSGNIPSSLGSSTYVGEKTVEGKTCKEWKYTWKDDTGSYEILLDIWEYNTVLYAEAEGAGWDVSVYLADSAQELTLSKTAVVLKPGQTVELTVIPFPSHAPLGNLKWSSSDSSVASVDSEGKVTAVAVGDECIITVQTEDGKVSAKCSIIVFDYS